MPSCIDLDTDSDDSEAERERVRAAANAALQGGVGGGYQRPGGGGRPSFHQFQPPPEEDQEFRLHCTKSCVKRMAKRFLRRLAEWLLEVEMGFVWGTAGLSIIIFVFAAIWYIDPALLTLVLRFRQATCSSHQHAFLIGISNCSWTSCRLGCTREVYKCWQIQVKFDFVEGAVAHTPPWASFSTFNRGSVYNADYSDPAKSPPANLAKLYPNVRGCGYPPELNCEEFYQHYKNQSDFPCWVSTEDTSVAMTELDLERAKSEVLFSLIPLLIFIVFVLYAFCRMGVFSVCNPLKLCPRTPEDKLDLKGITPKKLLNYKRGESAASKKSDAQQTPSIQEPSNGIGKPPDPGDEGPPGGGGVGGVAIPATILEEENDSDADEANGKPGGAGTNNSSGKTVITNAEVLPTRRSTTESLRSRGHTASNGNKKSTTADDDLSLIEQELFAKDKRKSGGNNNTTSNSSHPFNNVNNSLHVVDDHNDDDTKSETNTVINDLFGEEIERMDRERLSARYDVLDLKDIELSGYDNLYNSVMFGDSSSSRSRATSRKSRLGGASDPTSAAGGAAAAAASSTSNNKRLGVGGAASDSKSAKSLSATSANNTTRRDSFNSGYWDDFDLDDEDTGFKTTTVNRGGAASVRTKQL